MKIALMAAALAAASLGACSDNGDVTANDYDRVAERDGPGQTPDYRFNPPSANPDMRDIAPPVDSSPLTPQLKPTEPLAPPPGSPPPPLPAPESTPG